MSDERMGADTKRSFPLVFASLFVFFTAILLRLPACDESFWVDELHTAWTVGDGPGEVWDRARLGNQTPFYFWTLWGWREAFGEGERTLRLTSVLAVSLAAVVICVGTGILFRSSLAGLAAGMVLAVERNSIFFGTELRPYSFVILGSAISVVCFATAASRSPSQRGPDEERCRARGLPWHAIGLVLAVAATALLQPTSLGVLGFLPLILWLLWRFDRGRSPRWVSARGAMLLGTLAAVVAVLWPLMLGQVWERRQQWDHFASASSLGELFTVWDWLPLLVIPGIVKIASGLTGTNFVSGTALAAGIAAIDRSTRPDASALPLPERRKKRVLTPFLVCATLAVGCTVLYWAFSRWGGVPVWHRRYMIAVLPPLAFLSGGAVASLVESTRGERWANWLPLLAAILLPVSVCWYQGTLAKTLRSPGTSLVHRGEDWRAAADWLQPRVTADDRVYVMSGLIEAARYLESGWRPQPGATRRELDYLCSPILGPYRLPASTSVWPLRSDRSFAVDLLETPGPTPGQVFLLARMPASHLKSWLEAMAETLDPRLSLSDSEICGFGTVSVARLPVTGLSSR